MKMVTTLFATLLPIALAITTGCGHDDEPPIPANDGQEGIEMVVGEYVFPLTCYDNSTAEAFRSMLPITMEMSDLHGNEKYHYLSSTLPTNTMHPDTIHRGDIMLYGNNCIVVFYKTFATSYAYSPIGRLDDVEQLETALGTGEVTVMFKK